MHFDEMSLNEQNAIKWTALKIHYVWKIKSRMLREKHLRLYYIETIWENILNDEQIEYVCDQVFFYQFIYFWLRWVFVAACGLSLVVASRGCSLLRCVGFSLLWLLLLRSTGSRCAGFSSCGTWHMGSVVVACRL